MIPTLGRIVLLVNSVGTEIPAMITGVYDEHTVDLSGFPAGGAVHSFTSVKMEGIADSGAPFWKWPARVETAPAAELVGEPLMGGFNPLSLLGGDFGAIAGPLLVMLYNANRDRIDTQADRILTPPESSINFVLDRFGIKDPTDRAEFTAVVREWGDKGGDVLVKLSDLIAKKAGA